MGVPTLILIVVVAVQCVLVTHGQQDERFFRKDYTYIDSTQSFYKLHTLTTTWTQAKARCELEGATLFYPENSEEEREVMAFWTRTQPQLNMLYIGMSDLLAKGSFVTVDGKPVFDVYNNWDSSEPNDLQGVEDCVHVFKNGKMNDVSCDTKLPYICKKALKDVQWNQKCQMPRSDYVYNANFDRCYKFHNDPKSWTEAYTVCHAEGSYLAVINSKAEADYLIELSMKSKKYNGPDPLLLDQVFVGIHNKFQDGWKTIKGESLEASGYAAWGNTQPSGGDKEPCGSMFFNHESKQENGKLNDISCDRRLPYYICEHDISNATSTNILDDFEQIITSQVS